MADGRILFDDGLSLGTKSYVYKSLRPPNTIEVFDPKTDSWSYPNELPQSMDSTRHDRGSILRPSPGFWASLVSHTVPDRGYVPNGPECYGNDAAPVPVPIHFKDDSLLSIYYDLKLETPGHKQEWLSTPNATQSTLLYNLIVLPDERVFFTEQGDEKGVSEAIYDHKTDSWQVLNDPSAAVGQTTTLLPDGKILAIGGAIPHPTFYQRLIEFYSQYIIRDYVTDFDSLSPNYEITATCRLYDPTTNSWRITQYLNQGRAFHTASLLADGRVLVSGGYTAPNDTTTTATCEIISIHDIDP